MRPNREAFISSEAMRFLVYESNTSASTSLFEMTLSRRFETMIDLTPEQNQCSEDLAQTSIDERKCLFEWERQLK